MKFENISNKQLSECIDTWIKGERNRQIMKRRLIDLITYERLAEEFEMSVTQIKRIIYKNSDFLFSKI